MCGTSLKFQVELRQTRQPVDLCCFPSPAPTQTISVVSIPLILSLPLTQSNNATEPNDKLRFYSDQSLFQIPPTNKTCKEIEALVLSANDRIFPLSFFSFLCFYVEATRNDAQWRSKGSCLGWECKGRHWRERKNIRNRSLKEGYPPKENRRFKTNKHKEKYV